jgi:hypothetical protein
MGRRFVALAVCCLLPWAFPEPGARAQAPTYVTIWDLSQTQDGQCVVHNADADGSQLGMPVGAGNLNGPDDDDIVRDDVVVAPFYAPAGNGNSRRAAGKLHVYFGKPEISGVIVDPLVGAAEGSVEVWGAREGDFLGTEVDVADVTGDGLGDILACAENADGFGAAADRPQAGALYVITGRTSWPSLIDLANPQANSGVLQILGARATTDPSGFTPGDRLGFWAAAGDVTGDGVKDILVSADLVDGPNGDKTDSGAVYVIPGGPNLRDSGGALRTRIDLQNPGPVKVFTIHGIDRFDHLGSSISSADFDSDGFDDIICSAGVSRSGAGFSGWEMGGAPASGGGDGPLNTLPESGEVYIVYGRSQAAWELHPVIQLSTSPTDDESIYYGEDQNGYFGEDVSHGDFDGDGKEDLLVGALTANPPVVTGGLPYRQNAGEGYIFWGAFIARGEVVDLTAGHGTRVTRLYGEFENDIGADSIRMADLDGDGRDDLLFGSPLNPANGAGGSQRAQAGDLKIIFGRANRLPPIVDFQHLPAGVEVYQVIGSERGTGGYGDLLTYSLSTGDYDGDGFMDLMPNSMGADGFQNAAPEAGDLNIISGRVLSLRAGRNGGVDNPIVSGFTAVPGSGPYLAGASGITLTLTGSGFDTGATVSVNGVAAPAEAVTVMSDTQLRFSLDLAPAVRNSPGQVVIQVRNPNGGVSSPVTTIRLLGPDIRKVKAKRKGATITVNVVGDNFATNATVDVRTSGGEPVATLSVERVRADKFRVRIARGTVPRGSTVVARVVNPGPVESQPVGATIP